MNKIKIIKQSITDLHKKAELEKKSLLDSIEMMWLNAEVHRKKGNINQIPEGVEGNINRIRELLACAWFEDLKK